MDWIRLGHSGKDLTSVGGKKMPVSREELQKHNKPDDAWMAFRGKHNKPADAWIAFSGKYTEQK